MKESARAAREEVALRRQVAAVKELAGEEKSQELDALSGPSRYPEYTRLLQTEMIADILEDLAGTAPETDDLESDTPDLSFLTEEQAEALHDAGFTSPNEMREASDDELEAVAHVGKATVKKIRDALSQNGS